jgi:hypothetical protein
MTLPCDRSTWVASHRFQVGDRPRGEHGWFRTGKPDRLDRPEQGRRAVELDEHDLSVLRQSAGRDVVAVDPQLPRAASDDVDRPRLK